MRIFNFLTLLLTLSAQNDIQNLIEINKSVAFYVLKNIFISFVSIHTSELSSQDRERESKTEVNLCR